MPAIDYTYAGLRVRNVVTQDKKKKKIQNNEFLIHFLKQYHKNPLQKWLPKFRLATLFIHNIFFQSLTYVYTLIKRSMYATHLLHINEAIPLRVEVATLKSSKERGGRAGNKQSELAYNNISEKQSRFNTLH